MGCGQHRRIYKLEKKGTEFRFCKSCAIQAGWTKEDLRSKSGPKWGNDPDILLTIGPQQSKQERECDKSDGHLHCQECDECSILGNNVYILVNEGVEYWLCRKCAQSDKFGFKPRDLTHNKRFHSTAHIK